MFMENLLVAHGFVRQEDIAAAQARQTQVGGRLAENLVALGRMRPELLTVALNAVPQAPRTLDETGIDRLFLIDLLTKAMHGGTIDTPSRAAEVLKLPTKLGFDLMRDAELRQLVESHGVASPGNASELRYALTEKGRQWAYNALELSSYVGPAPVSLDDYVARIKSQAIGEERIAPQRLQDAMVGLTISERLVKQLGPAVNSGHSILLYGPPGNGKTSVAERIGKIFSSVIYVPHCFTVAGQIIKVMDPGIHQEIAAPPEDPQRKANILRNEFDSRWVACRRPCIVTGGELTLEMLDLSFNPLARFYEAPLHVKALNGIFLIDDFGRQIVSPEALLNRWIVPLASRVDYLKLHTGKSFSLPFDELVIFSTNLAPSQLMDPAFLRRIPFKIEIAAPHTQEYRDIFQLAVTARGLTITDALIAYVIIKLTEQNDFPLGAYQPWFLVDQVLANCKFQGIAPMITQDLLDLAISNLYTKDSPGFGVVRPQSIQTAA